MARRARRGAALAALTASGAFLLLLLPTASAEATCPASVDGLKLSRTKPKTDGGAGGLTCYYYSPDFNTVAIIDASWITDAGDLNDLEPTFCQRVDEDHADPARPQELTGFVFPFPGEIAVLGGYQGDEDVSVPAMKEAALNLAVAAGDGAVPCPGGPPGTAGAPGNAVDPDRAEPDRASGTEGTEGTPTVGEVGSSNAVPISIGVGVVLVGAAGAVAVALTRRGGVPAVGPQGPEGTDGGDAAQSTGDGSPPAESPSVPIEDLITEFIDYTNDPFVYVNRVAAAPTPAGEAVMDAIKLNPRLSPERIDAEVRARQPEAVVAQAESVPPTPASQVAEVVKQRIAERFGPRAGRLPELVDRIAANVQQGGGTVSLAADELAPLASLPGSDFVVGVRLGNGSFQVDTDIFPVFVTPSLSPQGRLVLGGLPPGVGGDLLAKAENLVNSALSDAALRIDHVEVTPSGISFSTSRVGP